MNILLYLHHPSQFHLFKNIIRNLKQKGNTVNIIATNKDILEVLLQKEGLKYKNFLPRGRKNNKLRIGLSLLNQDFKLFKYCLNKRPDILIGTSTEIAHIGFLLKIPSIMFIEDDAKIISLVSKIAYPFATHILSPYTCDNGKWDYKTVKYNGFQKLAYLHPNYFTANKSIVAKYFNPDKTYFILRFAKLTAHHDEGIRGISTRLAEKIINTLKPHGDIYITSERVLEPEFERYRLDINPLDIHHLMAFAKLYIGDSQSMAVEAAMLGIPSIRISSFKGRIGVLEELEYKYHLTFGIKPENEDQILNKINELIFSPNIKEEFQQRRKKMLSEKIDVTAFMVWFIENYPESVKVMKENPDYQSNFK